MSKKGLALYKTVAWVVNELQKCDMSFRITPAEKYVEKSANDRIVKHYNNCDSSILVPSKWSCTL